MPSARRASELTARRVSALPPRNRVATITGLPAAVVRVAASVFNPNTPV
ncbi:hypothetical protein LWC34_49555 [Kibdelosporangium philippinense]|uniref:Uncharacterized protein n=1 Tax=Kibdelosporangium philippinense TaxID=211113 RepID=A0ABS8ZM79_9PSEU|nr:hypothetical protein [Kibdelosporangium philippinense]MCE7001927.1 hypothetical protein [Kibdelosporangium philippinense]MCE7003722.1 hypothetical protein [Kibdelosporangium philippinense]MCE7006809.1 hypothetical protein [Kibdelosporangium philippinense]MCE7008672.1 hypothetical protein [Kibdelosporangium philippinense]MCE7009042.1 hypothetical protein [Kibdelosporangium philippinense]